MSLIPTTAGRGTCVVLAFAAVGAQAQQLPPDAGTLLRQQPLPPAVAPRPAPSLAPRDTDLGKVTKGPRFLVKEFRFTGAVLVTEAELQARVAHYRGQTVTLGILQLITQELTGYYLSKGYLARVIVPEQDIRDGIVEMKIIEGVRGSVVLDNRGRRVDGSRIVEFVDQRLAKAEPFSMTRLEEAIAILTEQPGVQLSTSLKPGSQEGEVDVAIVADDKPLVSGAVGINNGGSRGSGIVQVQGGVSLSNPTGRFDAASLLVNASEGAAYARADYSLAVGSRGLRLGVNAAHLDYRVIQSDLRPLDLHGTASTYGITWSYPLVRTSALSMSLAGSHDIQKFIDQSVAGETGNRQVTVTGLGISGSLEHQLGSLPSRTSIAATLYFGDSDEHNAGVLAADRAARQVNGSFTKFSYGLANLAELGADWTSSVALRGQFAGKNLDSSQRLSLGGQTGVRAYPAGEATGDEGWLINFNLRKSFGDALATTFFYDVGGITINKTTWANWNAGNPNLPNRYTLAGIGAGVDWRFMPAGLLSASIAVPVGSNPGRDANNRNADGRENKGRVWVSLNAQF